MAKSKSQRNREERERRIAKYGLEWERERSRKTSGYIPVKQLNAAELEERRKIVNVRVRECRAKKKQYKVTIYFRSALLADS